MTAQETAFAVRVREVRETLTALGIEPLSFERIRIQSDFARVTLGGLGSGTTYNVRFGVTIPCNRTDVRERWERRPVAEFILGGHRLSDTALGTLERIRTARLPIGCSVMVWTLGIGMHQSPSRDRMLVLECAFEFDRGTCFALCRWNG